MGFTSSCVVLLGVGVVGRVVKTEWLAVLGGSVGSSMWVVIVTLGVMGLWVVDNISGLVLGCSVSMGYGVVMLLGLMLWVWGELVKVGSGGVEYLGHYSVLGLQGVLGLVLPFMELLSIAIRPLTLSVRLSTNITSGHVLLSMVAVLGASSIVWGVFVGVVGWILGVLEVFVGVLQGGIFSLLVGIYME